MRECRAVFALVFQLGAFQVRAIKMLSDLFDYPGRDHHLHLFVDHAAVDGPVASDYGLDHFVAPLPSLEPVTEFRNQPKTTTVGAPVVALGLRDIG